MSKKFSLPFIDQKPPSKKDDSENYNFVKEGRKSRTNMKEMAPQNDDIDDLLEQIAKLKKELDQRNTSVMGLQRNFESLSTMLKTEKSENSRFKNELVSVREMNSTYLQKIKDLERYLEEHKAKLEKGKEEVELANQKSQGVAKLQNEWNKMRLRIGELEGMIEQRNSQNFDMSSQIRELQHQLSQANSADKTLEKDKKALEAEIQKIKEERDASIEQKNKLQEKIAIQEINLEKALEKIGQLQMSSGDVESIKEQFIDQEKKMKKEISALRNKESDLLIQLKKLENQFEAQQTLVKMKMNAEAQAKQETNTFKELYKELQEEVNALRNERGDCKCQKYKGLIASYEQLKEKCKDEIIFVAKFELENSNQITKGLRESGDLLVKEVQALKIKLADEENRRKEEGFKYDQMIKEEEEKSEREKNKVDSMQEIIKGLEGELDASKEESSILKQEISKLRVRIEGKEDEKGKIERQAEELKRERMSATRVQEQQETIIKQLKSQLKKAQTKSEEEEEIIKNLKQERDQELNKRREAEENIIQYQALISKYKSSEEESKKKEANLLEQITMLSSGQQQGESELNQMRSRIQQEMANSQSLSKAHKELLLTLQTRDNEIQNIRSELERKSEQREKYFKGEYEKWQTNLDQANIQKEAFINQSIQYQKEVEKLLEEKQQQTRNEQKKDNQIFKLELDVKSLTSKLEKAEKNLEDLDPAKVKQQILNLNERERLIKSSVAKIANAAEAAEAQFGCSYCGQTIKDAKTCAPCGHSYCDKCVKGYSPFCQECKKPDGTECIFYNKILDSVVGNFNYIRLTLDNIKIV